jgi:RecJ-like exonuclease
MSTQKISLRQINFEGLEENCRPCLGTGETYDKKFGEEVNRVKNEKNLSPLDAEIEVGEYWEGNTKVPCKKCDGKGTIPTVEGKQLLDFINKYSK